MRNGSPRAYRRPGFDCPNSGAFARRVVAWRRIQFRIGIHLGDVVEESDGDLMGDGVNIAARVEGIAKPGAICLSEQAYWQVKSRLAYHQLRRAPGHLRLWRA